MLKARPNIDTLIRPRSWDDFAHVVAPRDLKLMRRLNYGTDTIQLLLHGPVGLGKTELARFLTHAIICNDRIDLSLPDPCWGCPPCAGRWSHQRGPDNGVIEIDCTDKEPKSIRSRIEAHQKYTSCFKSTKFSKRVMILDEVHRNKDSLGEKLLKVVDDNSRDVFIAMTSDPTKLPTAFVDRFRSIPFRQPTLANLTTWLTRQLQQAQIAATGVEIGRLIAGAYSPRHIKKRVADALDIDANGALVLDPQMLP